RPRGGACGTAHAASLRGLVERMVLGSRPSRRQRRRRQSIIRAPVRPGSCAMRFICLPALLLPLFLQVPAAAQEPAEAMATPAPAAAPEAAPEPAMEDAAPAPEPVPRDV